MQLFLILGFCIFCLIIISIFYGIAQQELKQSKQDINTGERIDEIIINNSNLSDDDWNLWLQERRNQQK